MTKLGQDLIENLEEKLSQPIQSNTSAGFAARTARSANSDLRENLVAYFSNIINLPNKSSEYTFFKNLTRTDYADDNPEAKPWEYLGAPIEDVSQFTNFTGPEGVFAKDFGTTTAGVLDTEEKWKTFVSENLARIESDRKNESDPEFNAFIDQCLEPKNYRELLGIIKLIERRADKNLIGIQEISNWLLYKENDPIVYELAMEIEKNSNGQMKAADFFTAINFLEEIPDSLSLALDIAQTVQDYVISKNDAASLTEKSLISQAITIYTHHMRLISDDFKDKVSKTKAKDSPFIQSFLKQLPGSYNIDIARDFFGVPRDILLDSEEHLKKPGLS